VAAGALIGLAGWSSVDVVVVLAVLAAVVIAFWSPAAGLGAVIATLPWFYRPLDVGGRVFAASELLLGAVCAATALRYASMARGSAGAMVTRIVDDLRRLRRSPLIVVALVMTVLGLLLALAPYDATHRSESLREWRWTLLEPLILLALLVVHQRPTLRVVLPACLIAGATVAAGYALADVVLGGGVTVDGVTRIAGPYPHPNALALMTLRIVALALALFVFAPAMRPLIAVPLAVCGVALLATFSRGAMLGGAVALALVVLHLPARQRLVTFGVALAGLLLTIVAARDRMLDLFGGGSGSLRLDIWGSALRMIRDRPIVGYGPDQFLYAFLPRYVAPTAWGERFTAHAHNLVLDFWIRLGLAGLVLAVLAMAVIVTATIGDARRPTSRPTLARAATVGLAAALAQGLVDNAYFAHDLAMSAWLLAWLAIGVPLADIAAQRQSAIRNAATAGWRRSWRRAMHAWGW
jgi:O-antigen ligase